MSRLFLAGMVAYLLMLSGCGQAPEKQVTSYKVIKGSCDKVSTGVNEAILEGWQPIGGASGISLHSCVQAMVKTDT